MRRISDDLAAEVRWALDDLPTGNAVRSRLCWEVFPFAEPPGVRYMIGIGLRAPHTGDRVIVYDPVSDPYDVAGIHAAVARLFEAAVESEADLLAHPERPSGRRPPEGPVTS